MSDNNSFSLLVLPFCLLLLAVYPLIAQQKTDVDFDIEKVREAVLDSHDTMASGISSYESTEHPDSENVTSIIFRVTLYLALIVGVILVIAWIVRKLGITGTSRIGGGAMDVLEVLPFGQNRNALLIRVMDTVYLLGQTPSTMVLLEKIEGQKAVELISSTKGGTSIVHFKDAFNQFMGKIKKSS